VAEVVGTLAQVTELVLPWVPEGRLVRVEGRGELFARLHRHPDPQAPVVLLLHGWTASVDLQFAMAYPALAERYSFVGIDHRGHGRGGRTPDPFRLEDVADDAAALVRTLELGPVVAVGYSMGGPIALLLARRHPELVRGLVAQATALDWRSTWRDRLLWRVLPVFGSWLRTKGYRRLLNRAVPWVLGARRRDAGGEHPVQPYLPWLLSEMSRNDPFVMVEAGRALSAFDARPWAGDLAVPAGVLITTADRLVWPRQQQSLAAALGAETRMLHADHFATLSHPEDYAALTVELIDGVVQRSSVGAAGSLAGSAVSSAAET
jgi:pimeloyl-ACP methyl ester carboxylesterase